MKWLCWIGLHDWKYLTDDGSVQIADNLPDLFGILFSRRCRRCGRAK